MAVIYICFGLCVKDQSVVCALMASDRNPYSYHLKS